MTKEESKQDLTVLKQFLLAKGYTQRTLADEWHCSREKVSRASRGTEPTFTTKEIQSISRWLRAHFGKTWEDLPDSMLSTEPVDFLQAAIESQQKKSEG